MKNNFDLNQTPLVVIWEVTRACDLACFHCRASAQPGRNPLELSTVEGKKLIDDIAQLDPPIFIFTGGDPLKRPDIYELVEYAASKYLHPAMTPSATPLLNRESLIVFKQGGVEAPGAQPGWAHSGAPRFFSGRAWLICADAGRDVLGQCNRPPRADQYHGFAPEHRRTGKHSFRRQKFSHRDVEPVLHGSYRACRDRRSAFAEEFENAFAQIHRLAKQLPFKVKTTEAQHYRRYTLQHRPGKTRKNLLPMECRESYRSMKVRDSCSSHTRGGPTRAGFFPSLPAMFVKTACRIFIATPSYSGDCVTRIICRANAESVNSAKSVEVPERAPMP